MKPFLAILLANVVLLMNVGLTVSNHYCGGKLVNSIVTIGHGDVGCGMETAQADCENSGQTNSTLEKTCCGDQFLEFQIEDKFEVTSIEKPSVDSRFFAAFVIAYVDSFTDSNTRNLEYLAFAVPLLSNDFQVMYQSFLI